ncbi:MAG: hypothetical protein KAU17_14395 [Spirochaetales bacterium]|nr:hypothetical protein [Spirochaetales bacterium]
MLLKASDALKLKVPYPGKISADHKEERSVESELLNQKEFVEEAESLLAELKKNQPGFIFSNKINSIKREISLTNDAGLDLKYSGSNLDFELLIKEKGSPNIMDTFTGYQGLKYDRNEFLRFTNMICNGFSNKVDFEEGEYPVFFLSGDMSYYSKLIESLHGLLFGTGSSLFSGKLNEKLFADNFTVYQTRNREDEIFSPFFDVEGTVNKNFRYPLIENGVIRAPLTDKKTAVKYSLPHSGASAGEYDSVPTIDTGHVRLKKTGKTMKELLNGRKGIFVMMAMGGDFTPDGHYASPVQMAYQFDGENLIGKLPELKISGSMWDMFGKNFLGVSEDSITTIADLNMTAMKMKVSLL